MSVLRFPAADRDRGTVHVMPLQGGGFEVAHESRSGDSWGGFETYRRAEDAIAAAYVAAERYDSVVWICDAALAAVRCGSFAGDF